MIDGEEEIKMDMEAIYIVQLLSEAAVQYLVQYRGTQPKCLHCLWKRHYVIPEIKNKIDECQ